MSPSPQPAGTRAPAQPAFDFTLPPLPTTLSEALQITRQKDAHRDIRRLVAIVGKDPVTSAYILKRVNSSYYGLSRKTSQIDRAVHLLGFSEVCNLVIAAGLKKLAHYQGNAQGHPIYSHVMKTSVATAAYSRLFAEHLYFSSADLAFSAALLYQLGRLILINSFPDQYVPLWWGPGSDPDNGIPIPPSLQSEKALFGISSLELTTKTIQKWGLPVEMAFSIRFQEDPMKLTRPYTRLLALTIASGIAACDELYRDPSNDASASADAPNPDIPAGLAMLAQDRAIDVQELITLANDNREKVKAFVSTILSD